MENKKKAVDLIKKKLAGETFMSYTEIAEITGYHPKYILKLKKDVLNGNISYVHGNKNRIPTNTLISLYIQGCSTATAQFLGK